MKIQLAVLVAVMGLAACEREEAPVGGVVTPAPDPAPAVETPWYESLIGTKWHSHTDIWIYASHMLMDRYWEFVTDSTHISTILAPEWGEEFSETTAELKYVYEPDSLKLSVYAPDGSTQDYRLDTVAKIFSRSMPEMEAFGYGVEEFHLVEE